MKKGESFPAPHEVNGSTDSSAGPHLLVYTFRELRETHGQR
jgi:hypothetical protein